MAVENGSLCRRRRGIVSSRRGVKGGKVILSCVSYHRGKTVFIVNPRGGNGRTGRVWERRKQGLLEDIGDTEAIVRMTTGVGDAEAFARESIREGAELIVAVGGDGTLNEVVNGFFNEEKESILSVEEKTSTKLAVVPMGTGCDFARCKLWRKDDFLGAASRIARGQEQALDVIKVTVDKDGQRHTRICANIASFGISARVSRIVENFKWLGSKLSYMLSTVFAFFHHKNSPVTYRVNDCPTSVKIEANTNFVVGNGEYFGSGFRITPHASTYDGKLMLVVLKQFSLFDFIIKSVMLLKGTHVSLPASRVTVEKDVTSIDVDAGDFEVETDGEVIGRLPARFEVVPGAIQLMT